jgi:hypothetical protein
MVGETSLDQNLNEEHPTPKSEGKSWVKVVSPKRLRFVRLRSVSLGLKRP